MSLLLNHPPYGPRDDGLFLQEANELTRHHLAGCPDYARIWPHWSSADTSEELPYLHVGVFKHVAFRTEQPGIRHERTLKSSSTSGQAASRILLDTKSSALQSASTAALMKDFLGPSLRPLLILDSSKSLQVRGELSARIAAALSLRPLASDITFLLDDADQPASLNWPRLQCILEKHSDVLVYGFTWMAWLAWGAQVKPEAIQRLLRGRRIHFVHSGGWKKLEKLKVNRADFDAALLADLDPASRVTDFYGLVEQVGMIYPLCEAGSRHVPVWGDVLVRDPLTLKPLRDGTPGLLQLINTLAWGAPYHSVLTEDMGRLLPGLCPCGRLGHRFELIGRLPKAEVRGCANV